MEWYGFGSIRSGAPIGLDRLFIHWEQLLRRYLGMAGYWVLDG